MYEQSHQATQQVTNLRKTLVQAEVKQLPPLPAGVPELAGARAALERVRGQQTNEEAVTLLQQALASPSLLVRSATLKVSHHCTYFATHGCKRTEHQCVKFGSRVGRLSPCLPLPCLVGQSQR